MRGGHFLHLPPSGPPLIWEVSVISTPTADGGVAGRGLTPGPGVELWSNAQKRIIQGDTCVDKGRDFLGRGSWVGAGEEQQSKGNRENRHVAHSLRFYGNRISFCIVSGQSFRLIVFPGGAHITPPRMHFSKEGSGRMAVHMDCSLLSSFPNSCGRW